MQPNIIHLPHKFTPREYQKDPFRDIFVEGKRSIIDIWHRRAGKDNTEINIMGAATQEKIGLYLYLLPELTQAKKVVWKGRSKDGIAFLDHFPKELIASVNNTDLRVEFKNGSMFQLGGSDRYDSWMGTNPLGIVYSEYSLQNPAARDYFSPILAENGGWEAINGTPRGKNHLYELYELAKNDPDWGCRRLTVDDTKRHDGSPVITQEAIDRLRRSGMSEEIIQQEFYCSFEAAIDGAYYAKQIKQAEADGRIRDFPIEPGLPAYTFWDLGYDDSTSIWVMQPFRNEFRFIGYYENSGEKLSHYVNWLHDFRDRNGITYGNANHYLPHDVEVHELGTGLSRRQTLFNLGMNCNVVPKSDPMDGIEATRMLFPRFWIHKTNCKQGIRCLKEYHKEYDQKNHCYKPKPKHDWSSHGADAMRTFSTSWIDRINGSYGQREMEKFNVI